MTRSARGPIAGPGQGPAPPARPPQASEHGAPDWLLNVLTVSGPAALVAQFREAARGTGGIPWHLDLDAEEERILAPMAVGGAEARMLARQLREVLAVRHDRVLTRWAERGACPLDPHRLIPIPDDILQLGEDAASSQNWLRTYWGTTRTLRQVRIREEGADRRLCRKAEIVYEFRSADWTPWQAMPRLQRDWPKLILVVQPRYGDG